MPSPRPQPEQAARQRIDAALEAAGWVVQDHALADLSAGRGVALREFPMKRGHGFADYLLFVDGEAVGALEAKKEGTPLTGVEVQVRKYSEGLPRDLDAPHRPLPFLYTSTGVETRFTNRLDPVPRSREVFSVHRPETLAEWLQSDPLPTWIAAASPELGGDPAASVAHDAPRSQPSTLRGRLRAMPLLPEPRAAGLWPNQHRAVTNLERSLADNRPRALLQMATGSGKSLTAVASIYRLIKCSRRRSTPRPATPARGRRPPGSTPGSTPGRARAAGLAVHPSGMVAVCGAVATIFEDGRDAAAWIFRPDLPGETWVFDAVLAGKTHTIAETPRDCVFAEETLVMVGEAFGKHSEDLDGPKVDRHFIFELDPETAFDRWQIAGKSLGVQSGATAIDVDDEGNYVIVGYTCDVDCTPEADLRIYDPDGVLMDYVPLGALPTKAFGPHDVAWSPAHYAVVAMGGTLGDETTFSVRAFAPTMIEPVWTFSRSDGQLFHMALALAVGPYGEVYAGGFGANGYPAVAYVGG